MKVNIRLVCVEVPFEKSKEISEIEVPVGTSAAEALREFLQINDVGISLDQAKEASLFVNKQVAGLDTELNEGDILMVIRTLAGG